MYREARLLRAAIRGCLARFCGCALTLPLTPKRGCTMYFMVPLAKKYYFTELDIHGVIAFVARERRHP